MIYHLRNFTLAFLFIATIIGCGKDNEDVERSDGYAQGGYNYDDSYSPYNNALNSGSGSTSIPMTAAETEALQNMFPGATPQEILRAIANLERYEGDPAAAGQALGRILAMFAQSQDQQIISALQTLVGQLQQEMAKMKASKSKDKWKGFWGICKRLFSGFLKFAISRARAR